MTNDEDSSSMGSGDRAREARRITSQAVFTAFGPGGWARRFARLWGFLGFCLLLVFLARHIIMPFVFGLLVAYILNPLVDSLTFASDGRRRFPRFVSIGLCYLVILATLGLFIGMLLPRLSSDAARVGKEAPQLYTQLNDIWVPKVASWVQETFPSTVLTKDAPQRKAMPNPGLPPGTQAVLTPLEDGRFALQLKDEGLVFSRGPSGSYTIQTRELQLEPVNLEDQLRTFGKKQLGNLQHQLGSIFVFGQAVLASLIQGIFNFVLVLMVAAFILVDVKRISAFALSLIPKRYEGDYGVILTGFNRGLNGVIRGQLIICLVNGFLTWIGLFLFDVKYAFLLSVVATILSLIPIFGSILSTIPIVLAALVSGADGVSVGTALAVLLWIIGIHALEANLLNPRIMGSATKIHPVLVIFALVLGEFHYGLTGALLAVPAASMIQFLFLFFRDKAWRLNPAPADSA